MGLKPICILMVFIFLYLDGPCQHREVVDSLLEKLNTTKPDTSHVNAYLKLYYEYHRSNLDTAMEYAHQGKVLAEGLDYTRGLALATYRLGMGYRNLRNFDLAEKMQLHRKLKALTGHSAGEFIRIQRLIRASQMLSKTNNNISEVCYQTGFTSLSYFAKCFKKQFGATPRKYASSHA